MLAGGVLLAAFASACNAPGGDLTGQIHIDGSSTVFPISEAVAEEFSKVARGVRVNVGLSGTGGGFEKFCRGEIQISDASRPIKASEREACAANGITDVIELQVAIDALTVAVNAKNTWATCVTPEQIQLMFRDGGARRWKDVDPSWPDEAISYYYPGADSGTFDYFREAIIALGGKSNETKHRGDGTASEDDNILLKAVGSDRNAIAYFGFAYYREAGKSVKALQVDGGGGCVGPSEKTAADGSYAPLSRPLFIYTRGAFLAERPEILKFVQFYLDANSDLVPEVGYVSMPPTTLAAQREKLAPFAAGIP